MFKNKVPTPTEAHDENGFPRWDVLDPLLLEITECGQLTRLSGLTEIPHSTLSLRRTAALRLPPLPRGRPEEVKLTAWEEEVMMRRESGETLQSIADSRGVSHAAVSNAQRRVERKNEKRCPKCEGYGVVQCGAVNDVGTRCGPLSKPHQHVCQFCNGDGRV